MAKMLPLLLMIGSCALAAARPMAPMAVAAATPSPKAMPVPCYLKIYNGFCFTSSDKNACTFYANPSYATFKQCSEDPNMGKTVKCADVSSDLKGNYAESYKTCTDKEVLQGNSGSSSGSSSGSVTPWNEMKWEQMDNMDVSGKDIPSKDKPFTEVCVASWQGVDGVKKACAATSGCAGFTFDGKCGFLKTAVGEAKGRNGWAVFAVKKP